MTCSIYIYKPAKEPLVLEDDEISRNIFPEPSRPEDFEDDEISWSIFPAPSRAEDFEDDEEELDIEFLLNDLYRKVGILRLRIEQLEARL